MFQAFNVLRYEIGQKYNSHYDAFHPDEYGPQTSQRVHLQSKTKFPIWSLCIFPFSGQRSCNVYVPKGCKESLHKVLFGLVQVASFLLYLTDVEEGGETMFPYEARFVSPSFFPWLLLVCSLVTILSF